jgi:hypothetical protein
MRRSPGLRDTAPIVSHLPALAKSPNALIATPLLALLRSGIGAATRRLPNEKARGRQGRAREEVDGHQLLVLLVGSS